jgi:hypothetical protein
MELVTKAVAVLAVIAILVVLITPAPDELPGLQHRYQVSTAVALPQAQTSLPARVAMAAAGSEPAALVLSTDLLSVMCTRLC